MNAQFLMVLVAAAGAAAYLLRAPLKVLLGGPSCATGAGCAGCTAACPARKVEAVPQARSLGIIPGRLP
jgi:hypothetical protein